MVSFTYTQDEKREAIKDETWQKLRVALKGTTTGYKLASLSAYYNTHKFTDVQKRQTMIIIDNYLKALARGGQLFSGVNVEQAIENDFKLEVKR